MAVRAVGPGIYSVGSIDWDRRLFDELIPLPDGTSYNSYLIKGTEKTALIDTVDPTKEREFLENLSNAADGAIDYVVANHAEQDHSGAIPRVLELHPGAKVVCTPKCKGVLEDLLLISADRFTTVEDGDSISLGEKTLEFIHAPWVHWPETMVTYLREDRVLFSCDFFGAHLAASDLFMVDEAKTYEAAKRYYAEIMMPFKVPIRRNLDKVDGLKIGMIAPSHGPIYTTPAFITGAYREWTSDAVKNEVLIPYVSMHGSTARMVEYFVDAVTVRGIRAKPFNLTRTDLGELAIALMDAATLVVATPTVLGGPHPGVVYAATVAGLLKPKVKFASVICSFGGWGNRTIEELTDLLSGLKVDLIEPVLVRGYPKRDDLRALDRLADDIVMKHEEIGIAAAKGAR